MSQATFTATPHVTAFDLLAETPTAVARTRRGSVASIVLRPQDTTVGDLVLVDAMHPVSDAARRPRLMAPFDDQPGVLLARRAALALRAAVQEADAELFVGALHGYRSADEQQALWDGRSTAGGDACPAAAPGASEHETGLAVDLARRRLITGSIRSGFPSHGAYGRMRAALVRHGFVERYPQDHEHITGFIWQPTHFRYVGEAHALAMTRRGLTLEEWLAFLCEKAPLTRPLHIRPDGAVETVEGHTLRAGGFVVACAPVDEPMAVSLPHLRGSAFATVSGTNDGWCVITLPA